MSKILDYAKKTLDDAILKNKVFIYNGKYFKSLAFINGLDNEQVDKLKEMAKKSGFKYDYLFGCYTKPKKTAEYEEYRKEKDDFIDKFLHWKLRKPLAVAEQRTKKLTDG